MTILSDKPDFDRVLTDSDLALARESGWLDAGWFFSRARGRLLATRIRALPKKDQDSRITDSLELLDEDTLPGGTAQAWLRVLNEGAQAVCKVLEDETDGSHSQVLRTSIPAPLWEGLMTENERLELMARIRRELEQGN